MSRILFIFILLIPFLYIINADDSDDEPLAEVEGGILVTGLGKFQLKTPDILEIILRDRTTCSGIVKLCYSAAGMVEPMLRRYLNKHDECETDYCMVFMDPKTVICLGGSCTPDGAEMQFRLGENTDYTCPRLVSSEKVQNFTAVALPTGCEIVFKGAEKVIDEDKEKEAEEEKKRVAAAATMKYVYIGVGVGIGLLLLVGIIVIAVIVIRKRRAKRAAANQPVKPSKDKTKKSKQKDAATPGPSEDVTTSTVPVSLPVESTQQPSTPLEAQPEMQPPQTTVTPPVKANVAIEPKVEVTTPPPPSKTESKEKAKPSKDKLKESKEKLPEIKVDVPTTPKPPPPYPSQFRDFLEDAFDSLHRMGVLVLQPIKVKEPTGGLHPFMYKIKKDFDVTMARKVHQTELNLLTTPGAGKAFNLLNKMMKGARNELIHHGMSFTKDHRPEFYVLDDAMVVYLKNPNTPSFIVLYVFTLLYSNDFNMNDGIDGKLDRLSIAALFVVAMMIELPPYIRIEALTKFRYRMPQIYRLFPQQDLLLMPYPVNLMSKLSPRKVTKMLDIPPDVAVVDDRYFDQVVMANAPPNFAKTSNTTNSKHRPKRRALKSNNDKTSRSGEKHRKSPDKTSKSTEIQSPEASKSGEKGSKSVESNQSNASEFKKASESKASSKVNWQKNDEKSRSKESKTKENEV
uniref:FAS1 domain-containing protein n=1 Tax=Panagrellus redivivus TaxID=6233 RepID=A0A7E4V696_PANRE